MSFGRVSPLNRAVRSDSRFAVCVGQTENTQLAPGRVQQADDFVTAVLNSRRNSPGPGIPVELCGQHKIVNRHTIVIGFVSVVAIPIHDRLHLKCRRVVAGTLR